MKNGILLAALLLSFVGCGERPSPEPTAQRARPRPPQRKFTVRGIVKNVDPAEGKISIQHDEIPNYMPAMTMPFNVRDAAELEGLQVGDTISFVLHVTEDESWINHIKKQEPTAQSTPAARPSVRLIRNVEPLEEGDAMPDYRFTNQLGQAVSLSDLKGQALGLTFIFTRCPIPDFCPLMSKNFAAAHEQLLKSPQNGTNWHLFSISFDPHFDTPEVLRNYAQRYANSPTPDRWSFVTGAMIDIDAITEQFNLPVMKAGENWDHKLRTVVIDANGRIQKILIGNQWKPEEFAAEMERAMRPKT